VEEWLFEEVEGGPSDEGGDGEGYEEADELVFAAGGGVGKMLSERVVDGLQKYVEDVETVGDTAEPDQGIDGEDVLKEPGTKKDGNNGRAGEADGGEAKHELDGGVEVARKLEARKRVRPRRKARFAWRRT
jgi:hypothetical protein